MRIANAATRENERKVQGGWKRFRGKSREEIADQLSAPIRSSASLLSLESNGRRPVKLPRGPPGEIKLARVSSRYYTHAPAAEPRLSLRSSVL